jgi:dipeptidyl aminopeptidase/acylaminoacyl peptidase
MKKLFVLLFMAGIGTVQAQIKLDYQLPPEPIRSLADAPSTPAINISPNKSWMVLLERPEMPALAELASPELRLAGLRIDPQNFGPSRSSHYVGLQFKNINSEQVFTPAGLPQPLAASGLQWSPDSRFVCFLQTEAKRITLWLIDIEKQSARQLSNRAVSQVMGNTFNWLPNSDGVLVSLVPEGLGKQPLQESLPTGPVIEENLGKKAPSRTYQDLLKSPADEALFSYYASADLVRISRAGEVKTLLPTQLLQGFSSSPDGNYLLVRSLEKPFSYLVPYSRFPASVVVYDQEGKLVKKLYDAPLSDNIPTGFNATEAGPRSHGWRADAPADIYWIEALDGGDPKKSVEYRDRLLVLSAPFTAEAREIARTRLRLSGILWGDDQHALVTGRWWSSRREEVYWVKPAKPAANSLMWERSYEDAYQDPGSPLMQSNAAGRSVLWLHQGKIYLSGQGSSPAGDYPFLDSYELRNGKKTRLWQCKAPYYAYVVRLIDPAKALFISSRESENENPNYYLHNWRKNTQKALTQFPNPYPELQGVQKQQITYTRADGVGLSATLYLPAGYKKDNGRLPTLVWAYPREFKSEKAASQIKGSKHSFTRISSGSPIYWVTRGYAVVDNASMPIVGEGKAEPNDSFVPQLKANAQALLNYLHEMGVSDTQRVAVGGHSYGAFMTANLLAHSGLFKAGIARSGAYNRTLTPFGFQAEERTYWQAPEIYYQMSPFSYAHQIKTPILLIHGEADNNPGTFPMQSERLYNAIKGHGGTARYVVLPYESHGYRARENVMHMLWEMDRWLETYLKY